MKTKKEIYAEYLQSEKWKSIRESALVIHGKKCKECGNESDLQVHHLRYPEILGTENVESDLVVLCKECHQKLHKKKHKKIGFAFKPIPKQISKILCQVDFSSTESRIFWCIYDQTYALDVPRGDYRQISLTNLSKICNIISNNVCVFIKRLIKRHIILCKRISGTNAYKINDNVSEWVLKQSKQKNEKGHKS